MTKKPRHWHLTRDIKPRGECAACDHYSWKPMDDAERMMRAEAWQQFAESCCGKCSGNTCYVDQMTGA